jgi:hypothetical protein
MLKHTHAPEKMALFADCPACEEETNYESLQFSVEFEDLLRDGGDEAVTLVLHEAIERNDLPMIARITKMINSRAKAVETLMLDIDKSADRRKKIMVDTPLMAEMRKAAPNHQYKNDDEIIDSWCSIAGNGMQLPTWELKWFVNIFCEMRQRLAGPPPCKHPEGLVNGYCYICVQQIEPFVPSAWGGSRP